MGHYYKYLISNNTQSSLSLWVERVWERMVRLSHKCPWLTKKPKHSLERSFCGEWHEKIWVCGQPFLDSRNQSMEWSTGKRKVQRERKWFKNNSDTEFESLMWQIPLVFLLRFIHIWISTHLQYLHQTSLFLNSSFLFLIFKLLPRSILC